MAKSSQYSDTNVDFETNYIRSEWKKSAQSQKWASIKKNKSVFHPILMKVDEMSTNQLLYQCFYSILISIVQVN